MKFSYNLYSPSDDDDKLSDALCLNSGKQLFEFITQISPKNNSDKIDEYDDGKILTFSNNDFINGKRYCFNVNVENNNSDFRIICINGDEDDDIAVDDDN